MNRKLPLIIKREYLAKVRNKSFVIMTFLSPVLMVGMVVLIAYLTKLNDSEKKVVGIFNESDYFSTDFNTTESVAYFRFFDLDFQTAKDSVEQMGYSGLLHIPDNSSLEEVAKNASFYSKDAPSTMLLNRIESVFQDRLREQRLRDLGVSSADFASVGDDFEINTTTFSGQQNVKGINEIKAGIGGAFGYLIMMFIIIYGGFVMRSVIEEKTSRIIEVIISSVKPFQLMMGKIIGTALAGVTQFTIWMISAGLLFLMVIAFLDIDMASLTAGQDMIKNATGDIPSPIPTADDTIKLYSQEIFKIPIVMLSFCFLIYFGHITYIFFT